MKKTVGSMSVCIRVMDSMSCILQLLVYCRAGDKFMLKVLQWRDCPEVDSVVHFCRHFKIALAHQLDLKPKEALGYCNNAVSICEARVQRLKQELAEAKIQQVRLPGPLEAAFGEEGKQLKLLEDERREAGQDNSEDNINGDETRHDKDHKVAVAALDAEIKEIEESLVDLKEKVGCSCL